MKGGQVKKSNSISIGGIKIVIGVGASTELGAQVAGRDCGRALVVSDKGIRACGLLDPALDSLAAAGVEAIVFDEVPSDPPASVVRQGAKTLEDAGCDCVVAIGGGSVMDAAKAINLMSVNDGDILEYDNSPSGGRKFKRAGHPLFSIPTTSGTGSEVTQYAVITSEAEQRKCTIGDERLTSSVVLLDPLMTVGLPPKITAATGIDALAHAIEAYTSNRVLTAAGSTVFSDTLALAAVRHIAPNLGRAYACGGDIDARMKVMLGSTLAGLITQAGSGAAHGMGTPLGARYHVPHGTSVGIMLPYVMAYNLPACPERYRDVAEAAGRSTAGMTQMRAAREAVDAVAELLETIDFPHLPDFVPDRSAIDQLAEDAMRDKCCQLNARPLSVDVARELYARAWDALPAQR